MNIREVAEKAHPLFERNGWKYWNSKGDIATVKELEETISSLENSCWANFDDENTYPIICSSGRFTVILTNYESNGGPEVEYTLSLGKDYESLA